MEVYRSCPQCSQLKRDCELTPCASVDNLLENEWTSFLKKVSENENVDSFFGLWITLE